MFPLSALHKKSKAKFERKEIKFYADEMLSCALPDEKTSKPTVSLQLPEKVWYIDGKLVLTNMRLVFLPHSIKGDLFPAIFSEDRPEYLSIYLASIDHLVLVQSQRKKTKVKSFSPAGQAATLPGRVDKLEIYCSDFTRYKFCFNSPHRQRRGLLDRISSGGTGSGGGVGSQLSSFPEALRASLLDGLNRSRSGVSGGSGSAFRVDRQEALSGSAAQQQVDDVSRFLSNLCLFAFSSRRDVSSSSGLFPCQRFDYQSYMIKEWSSTGPCVNLSLSNGSRAIFPRVPTVPQLVDRNAVEYYRDSGYPRLVQSSSDSIASAGIVLRSARPKDDFSASPSLSSDASSSFFKQSMEFEANLVQFYPNLEIFDCDQRMPRLAVVSQSRRKLLRHCAASAGSADAMSLERLRKNDSADSGFYSGLEATGWLRLVQQCLDIADRLAHCVHRRHKTVWLTESADRDWNCLLSSLISLMLWPETRGIAGFERLIKLEWVSRHPFRARLLNLAQLDDSGDDAASLAEQASIASGYGASSAANPSQSSGTSGDNGLASGGPLFLLFLDCVWQLTRRYPSEFEFTSVYLTVLHDTIQWPVFQENATIRLDEILFNASSDGGGCGDQSVIVPSKLGSIFDWPAYIKPNVRKLFINRLYKQSARILCSIVDQPLSVWQLCELQFWTENYGRNARFASTDRLIPSTVYSAPTSQTAQPVLDSSSLSPPVRQSCFYGVNQQADGLDFGSPFSWSAGLIISHLLRNHLKEISTDFTQQLDPRALK